MEPRMDRAYTAFANTKKIASGDIVDVATKVKKALLTDKKINVLIFDDVTSQQIEIDMRGTLENVTKRLESLQAPTEGEKKPGRPKLGVISKEVTLLPEHWEWLGIQPGGASVTLRRLIEEAKKKTSSKDRIRQSQDATYKFMTVMAGDFSNYEEALRALYNSDAKKFETMISDWPKDVREHSLKLAEAALK
jgi:Uncharacterized protein conserved in bacteria